MSIEIISTKDGSHSLLNTDLRETYHSVHGALQESTHVFINSGLDYFSIRNATEEIRVLEVGFGSGLNAMLSLQYAERKKQRIHFSTLETDPLTAGVWQKLNYGELLHAQSCFDQLHMSPWDQEITIEPYFTLLKMKASIEESELAPGLYDVVFFDAFAPAVQPELWDLGVFRKIAGAMKYQGVFVTYSARGQLKRDLRSLGLSVESLPGPPGKKEMTRALKI